MFNLTPQESRVILFLITVALIGMGINFYLKTHVSAARVFQVDNRAVKLNLNEAAYGDLTGLGGLSANLARKIIAYRITHGPFQELEGLKDIPGIGEYRYEKLREIFYVEERLNGSILNADSRKSNADIGR